MAIAQCQVTRANGNQFILPGFRRGRAGVIAGVFSRVAGVAGVVSTFLRMKK